MTLLSDQDHQTLSTDATITISSADGRQQAFLPFRLGNQIRRDLPNGQRMVPPSMPSPGALALRHANGTPVPIASGSNPAVSVSTPVKGTPPPSIAHMKISSNGGMRISSPATASPSPGLSAHSPIQVAPTPAIQVNGNHELNGIPATPIEPERPIANGLPNGIPKAVPENIPLQVESQVPVAVSTSPARLKAAQLQPSPMPSLPNGYHLSPVNGYATAMPTGSPYMHPGVRANGLAGQQQLQNLKSAFGNIPVVQDMTMQANGGHMPMRTPQAYMPVPSGSNYSAQLAAARQMQWVASVTARQPNVGLIETTAMVENGLMPSLSPSVTPTRVPSSNGTRGVSVSRAIPSPALAHAMSPPQGRASPGNPHLTRLTQHSPSPHLMSPSLNAAQVQQSPTRQPQGPMPSPSLQSRQIIGSSGAGY